MRWVFLVILIYVVTLVQTTLAGIAGFQVGGFGPIRPDLPAILAVFVILHARNSLDAMIAAWLMGFAIDLTTGAAPGVSTAAGPMSLAYVGAAAVVWRMRELVFRDNVLTQCLLTGLFCILAHWLWITVQWALVLRMLTWSAFLSLLIQACAVGAYSALLAPLVWLALKRCRRWIFTAATHR